MKNSKFTIAGITAGVVFAVGFLSVLLIPGLGGTSKTKNFTDFYNSSGRRGGATILAFVLLVGCWLMIWFFTELRTRVTPSVRSELAYRSSVVGAALVIAGAAIELGPTMVQTNSDNATFVGIPIAHTFAQAGAGTAIAGMFSFALAVLLFGLDFRRTPMPGWVSAFSIVIAVLLISSFFGVGAYLLPVWTIVVGIAARQTEPAHTP